MMRKNNKVLQAELHTTFTSSNHKTVTTLIHDPFFIYTVSFALNCSRYVHVCTLLLKLKLNKIYAVVHLISLF